MWHLVILIQASYHVSWNCDLFSAHLSYLLGQLLDGVVIEFRTKMACHDSVIFFFLNEVYMLCTGADVYVYEPVYMYVSKRDRDIFKMWRHKICTFALVVYMQMVDVE